MTSNKTSLFSLLIVISMIIWGGSWVSAKAIANTLPSETLTFWRFFINFISFIPVLFFLKEPVRMSKSALGYTLLGSLFMGLYLYLFFKGLTYGFAGAAGVLVTTMIPIVTFILSIFLFRQKISTRDLAGLALGLVGGSILLKIWSFDGDNIFKSGNIYFLICAVLWSLLTICSQKAGSLVSPLIFSLFAYAFCSVLFFFASSRLSSYRASSFVFLVPSSAVIFSWVFLGEVPKISTIAGGLTAIAATYLINTK